MIITRPRILRQDRPDQIPQHRMLQSRRLPIRDYSQRLKKLLSLGLDRSSQWLEVVRIVDAKTAGAFEGIESG